MAIIFNKSNGRITMGNSQELSIKKELPAHKPAPANNYSLAQNNPYQRLIDKRTPSSRESDDYLTVFLGELLTDNLNKKS